MTEGRVARFDEIGTGATDTTVAPVARLDTQIRPGNQRDTGPNATGDAAPIEFPAVAAPSQQSSVRMANLPSVETAEDDGPPSAVAKGRAVGGVPVADLDPDRLEGGFADVRVADLGRPSSGGRGTTGQRRRRTAGGAADADRRTSGGAGRERGPRRAASDTKSARPADIDGRADAEHTRDAGETPDAATDLGRRKGRSGKRVRRAEGGRAELDPDADPVAVAREICLRLLTERARTRRELAQALRRKGVPDEAARSVLERFDEVGLIDDAAFAGQWVRSRHAHRGLARRALAVELRRKGVSDEDAGEALAEVDAESEERRARELVDRKLRSLAIATTEQRAVAARRLVGMLARKGYGAGVAYRVVREALAAHGADEEELGAEPMDD
jgi:regulatory protein